jgi:hypothetical protein
MTTHAQPATGRPVTQWAAGRHILRDHTVTGTATQLANLIANYRDAGTLVALTAPRRVTADLFQVVIRLREPVPARPAIRVTSVGEHAHTRVKRLRRTRVVVVTTVTATITGLAAVAAYLIGQLVELIAAHAALIVGVLALVALLAGLCSGRSGHRRHCPGC